MSSHATLSAASDDRKARLAKLKSLKRKQPDSDDANEKGPSGDGITFSNNPELQEKADQSSIAINYLSLRNYDPETRGPKLGFEAPPIQNLPHATLEEQAASLEDEQHRNAAEEAAQADEARGIDLFKLRPKKPNWDLKRELNTKLEVLNVRTDNAIARMVRERLEGRKATAEQSGDGRAGASLNGAKMVETLRLREKEAEEDQRREREEEATDVAA